VCSDEQDGTLTDGKGIGGVDPVGGEAFSGFEDIMIGHQLQNGKGISTGSIVTILTMLRIFMTLSAYSTVFYAHDYLTTL
jgi:hypothetical protein